MKFDITVKPRSGVDLPIFRHWSWFVAKPGTRLTDGFGYIRGAALESGHAITAASARRKGERAARRIAAGKGGGTQEYTAKPKDYDSREDLMETIARLEEELGL